VFAVHPTFSPTPSAPSVLFNARQYTVYFPPVDMSTSSQLVALVNADVRVPVYVSLRGAGSLGQMFILLPRYRQGNEWVDGQDASQIDHTLSIRDFLITSLAWNPHRVHLIGGRSSQTQHLNLSHIAYFRRSHRSTTHSLAPSSCHSLMYAEECACRTRAPLRTSVFRWEGVSCS
jgi:hypothetical protein